MYAQARYYLPEIGRFISEDNYKGIQYEPRTLNYYIYCLNNPINLIDPSGFCSEYDLFEFNPSFSKSYVVSGVKVGCDSYEAWYIIEKCKYLSREERIRINEKGTNSVKWTKLNPKNNPLYAKGAYSSTSKIIKNSKKAGLSGFTKGNVAFSAIGIGIDTYSNISDLKEQGADSETIWASGITDVSYGTATAASSIWAGAASGAIIGSLTCPVVGTIAGGAIGIVVSWGLDGLTSDLKENTKKSLSDTLK